MPVAALALLLCAPLLALIGLIVWSTSPGPVLFQQRRVGLHGRQFTLLKFRSMVVNRNVPGVTSKYDLRITPVGRWLRLLKLDELPGLWNVVQGDMSLVGSRPEVPRYVDTSNPLWQEILRVRPGLTDPTTLRLRNEDQLVAHAPGDPESFYQEVLLPYKLHGYAAYQHRRSSLSDVKVLVRTLLAIVVPAAARAPSIDELRSVAGGGKVPAKRLNPSSGRGRQSACLVVAVGLLLWHFRTGDAMIGNLLALRVVHQLVPPAAAFEAPFPLAHVPWVLGLAPQQSAVERDQRLMAALEDRAMRNGSGATITASYAMLTNPVDPALAERVLARVPEANRPLAALWRGRAAWAMGLKDEAARYWRITYGKTALSRTRFAVGLYVAARVPEEVLIAADAAISAIYLSDCDQACQTDVLETLRYWIAWPSSSEEDVVALCSSILDAIRPEQRNPVIDAGAANVLARQAVALQELGRAAEAAAALDRADALQPTVYVRAVRAYLSLKAGQSELAYTEALAAVREAGTDGHALMMAARTLDEYGARDEARRVWALTIQRVPRLEYAAQPFLDAEPSNVRN